MKLPRQFFAPLAIGAPVPMRDLPRPNCCLAAKRRLVPIAPDALQQTFYSTGVWRALKPLRLAFQREVLVGFRQPHDAVLIATRRMHHDPRTSRSRGTCADFAAIAHDGRHANEVARNRTDTGSRLANMKRQSLSTTPS